MNWKRCLFGFVFGCSACLFEARVGDGSVGGRHNDTATKGMPISPTLEPESDKKFFGKDYPWDKRPKVDVLHFKHPYPTVQDSGDFDSDYVKDENKDNGEWVAQTEYDRLRHKLAQERKDVAAAMRAKDRAEKELQDSLQREKQARARASENQQEKGSSSKVGEVGSNYGEKRHAKEEGSESRAAWPWPGGVASPGEVQVATEDAEKAVDSLEDCKKQLAEARENLKRLMDELGEAKKKQQETQDALDDIMAEHAETQEVQRSATKTVHNEEHDYLDAKAAYEKQLALVAQMEKDMEAAAAKVKDFRDAEDPGGGVYNTPRSATSPLMPMFGLISAVMLMLGL